MRSGAEGRTLTCFRGEIFKMMFAKTLMKILIFSVCLASGLSKNRKVIEQGKEHGILEKSATGDSYSFSKCKVGQHLNHRDRTGQVKLLICTEKIKGVPQWKFADGSSTLGEIFNPARDCSSVVEQLPQGEDGFYWTFLPNGTIHKVWCDVHTDGGGFTLVGMKDNPVSWTVPSNSLPVDPQGPTHWSSDLGDVKVLDFRVQFSADNSFENTKADWYYRVKPRTMLGDLFSNVNNGCPYLQGGIGNISFVKDLLTQSVLTNNFTCSKFGPHINEKLGWGKMNHCLRHHCKDGYAIMNAFMKFKYDNFGGYSYSAVSSLSGMNHESTAFVGCDRGKCCACFGPKGGRQNYCGPGCTAVNGGTVMKKAFVWFWVRTRIPERLWERCMEFVMKNASGHPEKHFIDPETGTAHKGSCPGSVKPSLNEGTLTVSDKESFEMIPDIPGLVSYRKDDKKLYFDQGSKWQALATENEFQELKKQIEKMGNMMDKLKKQNQAIIGRVDELHPPSCSALLKQRPSTTSGRYFINPLSSSPLVQVYCDMTSKNGVGVAEIGHDSESRTRVNGYSNRPGSYKRQINYEISMEQIVAIMKQSKNCEQFIKYECYASVMFRGPDAWWVSRQGSKMNYWGGAAVDSGKCACGMTNSCAGGYKCNCDMNDHTWREDSGYLTDKNTLPVTELRFADTDEHDEYGKHTLGKLRCWG